MVPDVKCLGPDRAIGGGCQSMLSWMEMTVYECVSREKALGLRRRFESLHLTLSASGWPM
jgi:hypothetical protein